MINPSCLFHTSTWLWIRTVHKPQMPRIPGWLSDHNKELQLLFCVYLCFVRSSGPQVQVETVSLLIFNSIEYDQRVHWCCYTTYIIIYPHIISSSRGSQLKHAKTLALAGFHMTSLQFGFRFVSFPPVKNARSSPTVTAMSCHVCQEQSVFQNSIVWKALVFGSLL